jgi:hypothetical protein
MEQVICDIAYNYAYGNDVSIDLWPEHRRALI